MAINAIPGTKKEEVKEEERTIFHVCEARVGKLDWMYFKHIRGILLRELLRAIRERFSRAETTGVDIR